MAGEQAAGPATDRSEASNTARPRSYTAELNARLRRLKVLRAAARALTPSLPGGPSHPPFEGTEQANALQDLAKRASQEPGLGSEFHAILASIDTQLLAAGQELRELVDTVPLVQLRASLPLVEKRRRLEVVALLDLLTSDPNGVQQRSAILDYLITLLSTEERQGKRLVTRDPVTLTPRLQRLCQLAESTHGSLGSTAAQELYAAASMCSEGDLEHLIARMRKRKQGLGPAAMVPDVLRAIVTYNTAIANRIEHELTEANRHADHDLLGWSDPVDEGDLCDELGDSFDWAGSAEVDAENAGSIFDSPGMLAIAKALQRRALEERLGTSAPERIAARLDLESLEESERHYLLEMHDSKSGQVLGLTLTVGLVIRSMLESTLDLREIGVDLERMQEDWAQELEKGLKTIVAQKISNQAYEEACKLSELKTRYLYESVAAVSRRNRESRGPVAVELRLDDSLAREAANSEKTATRRVGAQDAPSGLKGFLEEWRTAILVTVSIALCVASAMNMFTSPRAEIHYMTADQLARVSEYMISGYRDGNGSGPLFIGTLGKGWKSLDAGQKHEAARNMVRTMNAIGAREFVAVDESRRMQIQGTQGNLRFPSPPADSD